MGRDPRRAPRRAPRLSPCRPPQTNRGGPPATLALPDDAGRARRETIAAGVDELELELAVISERFELRGPRRQPGFAAWYAERWRSGWRIYIARDESYAIALRFVRR